MHVGIRSSALAAIVLVFTMVSGACSAPSPRVLVFSKTAAFRHASIETGIRAIHELGGDNGFAVEDTEDATVFDEETLRTFDVVVFLSTTGDVLNAVQQADFERFIQAGGGYVGIHAASDTEYGWPWYGDLVGAYFVGHPEIQQATLRVEDADHPATRRLRLTWTRTDEWYDLRYTTPDVRVLLTIDEDSYTALGHTAESYDDPDFLRHLAGGVEYALGERAGLDYSAVHRDRLSPHGGR